MSRLIGVCLVGVALVSAGCGSSSKELPPSKEPTKQASKEEMDKVMQESMNRNNAGGRSNLQVPDQNKAP